MTGKKIIQKKMETIRVFILGMGGVIYLGKNLFPHTHDFLNTVKATEREYYFFTNNSSRDLTAYIDELYGMGIDIDRKRMMVSAHVILRWLKERHDGRRVYVVRAPALHKEFEAHGWVLGEERPDTAILGLDATLTYEKLSETCTFIRESALYYGVNPNLNCPMEHDTFIPDCGSMTKLIETNTGKYPEFFKRPNGKTLDYIVEETGRSPDQVAIVGDCLYTNTKVTDGSGVTGTPVLSGETKAEGINTSGVKPGVVIEHVGELAELLQGCLKE